VRSEEVAFMDTLTAIKEGQIITPIPIQILFGGCPIDPDYIYVSAVESDEGFDETLDARCSSL
jgi:hypothetical protein